MSEDQNKFEGWAVVEIMGHNREIGYVTTQYFGGSALFRVDQPELPEREYTLEHPQYVGTEYCPAGSTVKRVAVPAKTAYVGASSVFRMTPCTEEMARASNEQMIPRPIQILHIAEAKQLEPGDPDDNEPEF